MHLRRLPVGQTPVLEWNTMETPLLVEWDDDVIHSYHYSFRSLSTSFHAPFQLSSPIPLLLPFSTFPFIFSVTFGVLGFGLDCGCSGRGTLVPSLSSLLGLRLYAKPEFTCMLTDLV